MNSQKRIEKIWAVNNEKPSEERVLKVQDVRLDDKKKLVTIEEKVKNMRLIYIYTNVDEVISEA